MVVSRSGGEGRVEHPDVVRDVLQVGERDDPRGGRLVTRGQQVDLPVELEGDARGVAGGDDGGLDLGDHLRLDGVGVARVDEAGGRQDAHALVQVLQERSAGGGGDDVDDPAELHQVE